MDTSVLFGTKYQIIQEIHNGFYGPTYVLQDKTKTQPMICKSFPKEFIGNEEKINSFRDEIKKVKEANLSFIVTYTDVIETNNCFFLIRPYLPFKSLTKVICSEETFDDEKILYIWKLLVKCYQILHKKKIIPNTIKPNNIFLTPQKEILITDLYKPSPNISWAFETLDPMQLSFLAPEYFSKIDLTGPHSDVWALGVLMAFMKFKSFPWPTNNAMSMVKSITDGKFAFQIPNNINEDIKIIIESTIKKNFMKRPSIESLSDIKSLRQYVPKERRLSSPAKLIIPKPQSSKVRTHEMGLPLSGNTAKLRSRSEAIFRSENSISSSIHSKSINDNTSSVLFRCRFPKTKSQYRFRTDQLLDASTTN
ncbi:CAMK family protein kinase [Histomonas meleagridis]|uniref:CAMK family protein kinase n=1 Tax=Histomonas meleagridis TaxID=135588 RepID=UPI00355A892B|nr:CAMK family protein kinase [Histomonas meleagridis]KAH0804493.1 CAMK family protein kinase [Histomonas meleagridis]